MRNIFLLFLFSVIPINSGICQQRRLNKDTSGFKNSPLYIYNAPGNDPVFISALILNPKDIESIYVAKTNELLYKYGPAAKNGIVVITPKPNIELLTAAQLFDKFNIDKEYKNLPLFIDSTIVSVTYPVLFQLNWIRSVKVEKGNGTNMKYISVRSYYATHSPKPGEVNIKGYATDTINKRK